MKIICHPVHSETVTGRMLVCFLLFFSLCIFLCVYMRLFWQSGDWIVCSKLSRIFFLTLHQDHFPV